MDLNMALMRATFKLDQRQDDGATTVGTGWLVRLPGVDGRLALVTAGHVLDRMQQEQASIHWRRVDEEGRWHREPAPVRIRDRTGAPLWHRHADRDIAALALNPPAHAHDWAIGFDQLADDEALKSYDVQPGDEMLALGYPRGLSANEIGFPILRAGRVASYPLWPSADFPTFLMDFAVFAGNSGGPVYMSDRARKRVGASDFHEAQFVAGLLAQQVVLTDERLEIGIVLHAAFIRQCLLGLDAKLADQPA
ncbi:serine protease [Aquidulcibacter sp.]|uniref:S1 family peptidase n=1 Tax=Aquidulcibacter sp. TaxID=2052990 RepID=UPI0025BD1288|nr:serine protease [Aquidulcibacter sp.]MCA3693878.1 trypsin-like peptidase domain-containing protein [Aquidulcibacter sp.]